MYLIASAQNLLRGRQSLAPEYAKAATAMQALDPSIIIGKVRTI